MKIKHLGNTDFESIMECFLISFMNYFVKMPTDHNYYRQRWKAAGVQFDLSYGMFDNDKLVGFIINAIDERQSHFTAYNSGTGVIPEYRGKRIVKSIYEFAIPDLIKNGITKCQLEVITENEKAIKAYKGIGFEICKTFKCYSGELSESKFHSNLKELTFDEIDWNQIPNQDRYSWDFQHQCIRAGNSKYYIVTNNKEIESFFAINIDNGTINQFDVLNNSEGNWERLFLAIATVSKQVRTINVDDRLVAKIQAIEHAGLKNTVNQFEMELFLK